MSAVSAHDIPLETWLDQARDDLEVAHHLFDVERTAYALAFAHLAVEKALKGLYRHRFEAHPPVTHDLGYLADRTELLVPDDLLATLHALDRYTIVTLYTGEPVASPGCEATRSLLTRSRELMDWITDHF